MKRKIALLLVTIGIVGTFAQRLQAADNAEGGSPEANPLSGNACLDLKVGEGEEPGDRNVGRTVFEVVVKDYTTSLEDEKLARENLPDMDFGPNCEFFGDHQTATHRIFFLKNRLATLIQNFQSTQEGTGKSCEVSAKELRYEVVDIKPPIVVFDENQSKQIEITLRNTGDKTWNERCNFALERGPWRRELNQARKTRGFTSLEDIPGFTFASSGIASVTDAVPPQGIVHLTIKVSSAEPLLADQLLLQNVKPENAEGIYLYGVKKDVRRFQTSRAGVSIYHFPSRNREPLFKALPEKNDLKVIGRAVPGQFVPDFKTSMWYPVEYKGEVGFIPASAAHEDWVNWNIVRCKSTDTQNTGVKNELKTGIVLHFTGRDKEAAEERNDMNHCLGNESGSTHFLIGKNGEVIQAVEEFNAAWHAGVDNDRSLGITLVNYGPMKKRGNDWYDGRNKEFIPKLPADVSRDEKKKKTWEVWSMPGNANLQAGCCSGKDPYWASYTTEQIQALKKALAYLEEKFDIPHRSFEYEIPGKGSGYKSYGFYFAPQQFSWNSRSPELSTEWIDFQKARRQFNGIYSNHNVSGQYDPGPHLDIQDLGLTR